MLQITRKTEKKVKNLTPEEQLNALGEMVAQEKIKNMQKDTVITNLGQELAKVKLEVMQLKGGSV